MRLQHGVDLLEGRIYLIANLKKKNKKKKHVV